MSKKIIFSLIGVLTLVIIGGGFFWWQNQKDVRELNKNLPKGVRVVKSLFGKEYKVVNKIDGYEFRVPKEWEGGIRSIAYYYESEKNTNRIILEGPWNDLVLVDKYIKKEPNIELKSWVSEKYQNLLLMFGEGLREYKIEEERLGNYKVVKVLEGEGGTIYVASYFLQDNSTIYEVRGTVFSGEKFEELLREIILNGKW